MPININNNLKGLGTPAAFLSLFGLFQIRDFRPANGKVVSLTDQFIQPKQGIFRRRKKHHFCDHLLTNMF